VTAPRVALVTHAGLAELTHHDRLLFDALAARGVATDITVWDDPAVAWSGYDLVVLRSPWDYSVRRDEFLAWADAVPALANPATVVRWNTDKRYLRDLAAAGLPVVPTTWLEPGERVTLPAQGEFVVKPAVSAGSVDTGRYDAADPTQVRLAAELAGRLLGSGRTVMVQPYLTGIDTAGETALLFLGGAFSHAIRKGPILGGPYTGETREHAADHITARTPSDDERRLAERVLAEAARSVPGAGRLLYARVDLVPGPAGDPVLLELELTEPSLFLADGPGAADRLAEAVRREARTGVA
jgi:hypothetical protein